MTEWLILISLLVFSALCTRGQVIQSIKCGNLIDGRTETRRNSLGTTVVLQMHAQDDSGKNSHLCESKYWFLVKGADGTSVRHDVISIDDSWGRSMKFWISGFTSGGHRVIATIWDYDYSIVSYDLQTDEISTMDISRSFLNKLGPSCGKTLAVLGTTRDGYVVISIGGKGCESGHKKWKVKPGIVVNGMQQNATLVRLPDTTEIKPIE